MNRFAESGRPGVAHLPAALAILRHAPLASRFQAGKIEKHHVCQRFTEQLDSTSINLDLERVSAGDVLDAMDRAGVDGVEQAQ